MAKNGFRSLTVRERTAALALKKAVEEDTSMADIIDRAVGQYVGAIDEAEQKIRLALKIMREQGIL